MRRWMGLSSDFRGVTYCAIDFEIDGDSRRASIPGVMDFSVEGIRAGSNDVMRLENAGHPVNSTLALARGTGNTYTGHGMTWDNTGRNGHYAPFQLELALSPGRALSRPRRTSPIRRARLHSSSAPAMAAARSGLALQAS